MGRKKKLIMYMTWCVPNLLLPGILRDGSCFGTFRKLKIDFADYQLQLNRFCQVISLISTDHTM